MIRYSEFACPTDSTIYPETNYVTVPDLILEFTKMNGAGNDFIVIDNRFFAFSPDDLSRVASVLCPRGLAIGADGLLAIESRGLADGLDFRMRYYNSDGSSGSMCGNGARCIVRFAADAGIIGEGQTRFLTDAGEYRAVLLPSGDVRLFVPVPSSFRETEIAVPETSGVASYIWTGTEHAVCYVPDVEVYPVEEHGRVLRRCREFGAHGVNVNFVHVQDRDGVLNVRTYEKGVESETLACGTGAIASAVVSHLQGRTQSKRTTVKMRGGTLTVGFEIQSDSVQDVYLEGPAITVYRGSCPVKI